MVQFLCARARGEWCTHCASLSQSDHCCVKGFYMRAHMADRSRLSLYHGLRRWQRAVRLAILPRFEWPCPRRAFPNLQLMASAAAAAAALAVVQGSAAFAERARRRSRPQRRRRRRGGWQGAATSGATEVAVAAAAPKATSIAISAAADSSWFLRGFGSNFPRYDSNFGRGLKASADK